MGQTIDANFVSIVRYSLIDMGNEQAAAFLISSSGCIRESVCVRIDYFSINRMI